MNVLVYFILVQLRYCLLQFTIIILPNDNNNNSIKKCNRNK